MRNILRLSNEDCNLCQHLLVCLTLLMTIGIFVLQ